MNSRYTTQQDNVEKWLLRGKSITSLEALQLWGAFRLSAIIFNLRKEGHNIKTKMIKQGRKTFAEYSIDLDQR
tara:strand:- start:350 stop:568 length:219 start_codon:yes stop_codon:yes gene_type:complete